MAESGDLTVEEWSFWDRWMCAQRLLNRTFDQELQRELGISKADFGVLVTLDRAPAHRLRVSELAVALDWDKGRAAHHLSRMEQRGLLERREDGAPGRRTGIRLTPAGRRIAEEAIRRHAANIRRLVLDRLTDAQRATISTWTGDVLDQLGGGAPETTAR